MKKLHLAIVLALSSFSFNLSAQTYETNPVYDETLDAEIEAEQEALERENEEFNNQEQREEEIDESNEMFEGEQEKSFDQKQTEAIYNRNE